LAGFAGLRTTPEALADADIETELSSMLDYARHAKAAGLPLVAGSSLEHPFPEHPTDPGRKSLMANVHRRPRMLPGALDTINPPQSRLQGIEGEKTTPNYAARADGHVHHDCEGHLVHSRPPPK